MQEIRKKSKSGNKTGEGETTYEILPTLPDHTPGW